MYSFIISFLILVVGYILYGAFVERVMGVDSQKQTPAYAMPDGVDYIPMPTWKVFLIQFLNIAGLGPIFGAIMGVMYGPASFLWIAIGTIFGGAVHDYFSGMLSVRSNGASLPEIVGDNLGNTTKQVMRVFSLLLMVLVGAVFVINPADLLANLCGDSFSTHFWVIVIFAYYMLATLLPIDKLIGNLYPVFGFALLFMAVGIFAVLLGNMSMIPEFTDGMHNRYIDSTGMHPLFPMMFVSIACGAISGFHATQSPMMARCIKNERYGRRVFYGAMVAEGLVALIWAAAAISFFEGSFTALAEYLSTHKAAALVNEISTNWLGAVGGFLAILGVIAAPITSGDTALRSARLIAADFMRIKQNTIAKRLMVSLPIFVMAYVIMQIDFQVLWRYFGWCNQTLSVFTLWAITMYLARNRKAYVITLIPAMFMTMVCSTYILYAPEGFDLAWLLSKIHDGLSAYNYHLAIAIAAVITSVFTMLFYKNINKTQEKV